MLLLDSVLVPLASIGALLLAEGPVRILTPSTLVQSCTGGGRNADQMASRLILTIPTSSSSIHTHLLTPVNWAQEHCAARQGLQPLIVPHLLIQSPPNHTFRTCGEAIKQPPFSLEATPSLSTFRQQRSTSEPHQWQRQARYTLIYIQGQAKCFYVILTHQKSDSFPISLSHPQTHNEDIVNHSQDISRLCHTRPVQIYW